MIIMQALEDSQKTVETTEEWPMAMLINGKQVTSVAVQNEAYHVIERTGMPEENTHLH